MLIQYIILLLCSQYDKHKKTHKMQIVKPTKFKIVNEKNHFFSVTMTGKPTFLDSKEWGYSYDKERADEVAAELTRQGFNVSIIPVN